MSRHQRGPTSKTRSRSKVQQLQESYDVYQIYHQNNQEIQTGINLDAEEAFNAIFENNEKCASRTKIR